MLEHIALKNIKDAITGLEKAYGYDRYVVLLRHVKQELEKDILKAEAEENQKDILDLIPARKVLPCSSTEN